MTTNPCPVRRLVERLSQTLATGRIRKRRHKDAINLLLRLLDDISFGRGKAGHLDAMESSAHTLMHETPDRATIDTGRMILSFLEEQRPIFLSHIDAHYCPTGECAILSAAPCQLACPASVDAPSYVALVGKGRYLDAMKVLMEDLPIPGSLGRVCIRPCEKACRRGQVDVPIAICKLKRVAFDEALKEGMPAPEPTPHRFKEKVAVIGSGPAGLSTVYFLAKKGYRPIIFESMPEPGGMLRWGIPAYRLPRHVVETEIDYIRALGVEIRTNMHFGTDISLESLKQEGYGAVFLGTGAWCCMELPIQGAEENPNVIECLTFLRFENIRQSMVGRRVIVVGGGNAAVDCVRTALRLDVDEVRLVYRRSRLEMPAHKEEVEAAEKEGAVVTFLTSPVRVLADNGKIAGLVCIQNSLSEPDPSGRRRPIPIEGSEYTIPADTIISAIGQHADITSFEREKNLEISKNLFVMVDPVTLETTIPGVFAGGDAVTGPATVIEAVAAGKKAAESIHLYLRGHASPRPLLIPARRERIPVLEVSAEEKSRNSRPTMPEINLKERQKGFKEVELGLTV